LGQYKLGKLEGVSFVQTIHPRFAPATRLLWHAGVLGALEQIQQAGFQAAEVWASHLSETGVSPKEVGAAGVALGLKLSLHAPSYDLNPLSSNTEVRSLSRRLVLDSFTTAAIIGAKTVVVHPGALSSSTDNPEDYWGRLEEYLVQLDAKAAHLGLEVAIEAMEKKKLQFITTISSLGRLAGLLETVSTKHLGLCVDIAHAGTIGDPLDFLAAVPKIIHAHLSDTSEEKTHALLGEGRLDLASIIPVLLKKLETTNGLIAIEGRLAADETRALQVAKSYLQKL
jgi:sugar phosphate isomerase/epimerase